MSSETAATDAIQEPDQNGSKASSATDAAPVAAPAPASKPDPDLRQLAWKALSVLASLRFDVMVIIKNIGPKSFYPSPESFSSLVCLNAKEDSPKISDDERFVFFVKTLFRYQNKNLSNAFRNAMPDLARKMKIDSKKAEKIISGGGFGEEKVNLVQPDVFAEIFRQIVK